MLPFLEVLEKANNEVSFATEHPSHLAYKLREASAAVQHHDGLKDRFGHIMDKFTFKVQPGRVLAVPIPLESIETEEPIIASVEEADPLGEKILQALESTSLVSARTLEDVIGGAIKYANQVDQINFPHAVLKSFDLERLFRWTSMEKWKIINHEDWGITLTKRDIDPELEWKPDGGI